MPLTSQQKHYIKKNVQRYSPEEIADKLNLPSGEIHRYIKNRWGDKKIKKMTNQMAEGSLSQINLSTFRLRSFLSENINYFIFLFVLVFLSYFNSLSNDFVSDDIATILKNPNIGNLGSAISTFLIGSIHSILDFLIYKIFGLNPIFFRIINILFHLGSVWIIYILASLLVNKKVGIISACLFAVHPILTESVAWISGAPYVLYGFFILLSFLTYILSENNKKVYYLSIASFIFAIFSSDKVLFFPVILIAYEFSFCNLKKNWRRIIPHGLISLALIILSITRIGTRVVAISQINYQQNEGFYNPLTQIPTAISTYLKLMFWPQGLTLYQTELNFSLEKYIFLLAIFVGFMFVLFYGWKKNRLLFFWLSFFIITLSPTLTPLKISWIVAERYVYLGSIGIFVSMAMLLNWMLEKHDRYKIPLYSISAIILIALYARTIARNVDWKNEDNLWIATVKTSPSGPNIHNNVGDVYARNGDFENAAKEFSKSIEINPNYGDAYHNLANTYKAMGKIDLAIENYNKALSINPNIWQSRQNLAGIYYEMGDMKKAEEHMKQAVKIDPNNQNLQQNLSLIQSSMKK